MSLKVTFWPRVEVGFNNNSVSCAIQAYLIPSRSLPQASWLRHALAGQLFLVLSLGLLLGRAVYAWIFMYFRLKILRLLAFGWKSIFENTWGDS